MWERFLNIVGFVSGRRILSIGAILVVIVASVKLSVLKSCSIEVVSTTTTSNTDQKESQELYTDTIEVYKVQKDI